ncbi:MAG: YggT family protein [Gammaproteobacteria bacterium]|nr:YggT family protein [Gammaproteobacteria bacterium]
MGGYVNNATVFLVDTLFGLYILVVLIRFLLQWLRADFYNPVSQFVITVTNPPVRFFRGFIPVFRNIDFAAVVLLLVLSMIKSWLLFSMIGHPSTVQGLLVYSIGELLQLTVYVFIFAILIRVVLSWIAPQQGYNPALRLLYDLTEPVMEPARRLIPPIAMLDISPIVVFIFLYLTLMLIVQPIMDFGIVLNR